MQFRFAIFAIFLIAPAAHAFEAKISCYSACLHNESNCDEYMEGKNATAYCGQTIYRPRDHTLHKCIMGETDIVVVAIQQKHTDWAGKELKISNLPDNCHYFACDSYAHSEDAYGTKIDISVEPDVRDTCDIHGSHVDVEVMGKVPKNAKTED